MKFYPDRFGLLAEDMSLAEEGALFKIIRHLWSRGPLPEAEVRRLCKDCFEAVSAVMIQAEGGLTLELVEIAMAEGKRVQVQKIEAGRASAAKRNGRSTDVEHSLNGRSTAVLSISKSSSDSEKKKERAKIDYSAEFEALWKVWESKGSKAKAFTCWLTLTPDEQQQIVLKAPFYVKNTSGDRIGYRKNLEGWINPAERRWEAPVPGMEPETPKLRVPANVQPPDFHAPHA